MLNVFGWMADQAGCGYYRMALPLAELARIGYSVEFDPTMTDEARDTADVIVGQRVCKPGPSLLWQQMARKGRARLVYEIDDDLFRIDPSSSLAYEFYSRPEILTNVIRNASVADAVTVSTEPLADVMRNYNPHVLVVPNRVPGWLLNHSRSRREALTIGWAGSGTHVMDFTEAGYQVARFLNRNPSVAYHVIGGLFDYQRWLPMGRVTVSEWYDSVDDYLKAVDFDIALAPLAVHAFNNSKSPIKAIEAGALRIPIVASAVGPYADYVEHGVTGLLVKQPHEWGKHLRTLVNDPAMQRELGDAAWKQAASNTVEGNIETWIDALGIDPKQNRMTA